MVRVTIETDTDVIGIQSPMLDTRYHSDAPRRTAPTCRQPAN